MIKPSLFLCLTLFLTGLLQGAEVMTLVDQHYPSEGERLRPNLIEGSDKKLSFFMNPEDSAEPNCEGIFLQMQDNKVVRKSYARDWDQLAKMWCKSLRRIQGLACLKSLFFYYALSYHALINTCIVHWNAFLLKNCAIPWNWVPE